MFKKIKTFTAYEIRSVIHFLIPRDTKPIEIHYWISDIYRENVMSDSLLMSDEWVQRWVQLFNKRCDKVHKDEQSHQPSLITFDLEYILWQY